MWVWFHIYYFHVVVGTWPMWIVVVGTWYMRWEHNKLDSPPSLRSGQSSSVSSWQVNRNWELKSEKGFWFDFAVLTEVWTLGCFPVRLSGLTGRSRAALGLLGPQRSEDVETPHAERHHSEMDKNWLNIVFLGTVTWVVCQQEPVWGDVDGNMMTKVIALSLSLCYMMTCHVRAATA